jgi:hypothetical protein
LITRGLVESAKVQPVPGAIDAEDLLERSHRSGGETMILRSRTPYGKGGQCSL